MNWLYCSIILLQWFIIVLVCKSNIEMRKRINKIIFTVWKMDSGEFAISKAIRKFK